MGGTATVDEQELANELEGMVKIDAEPGLITDVATFRALRQQRDQAIEALDVLKKSLLKAIVERDAQAFTLDGKVCARRSLVTNMRLNGDALKQEAPELYAKHLVTTPGVRLTVP